MVVFTLEPAEGYENTNASGVTGKPPKDKMLPWDAFPDDFDEFSAVRDIPKNLKHLVAPKQLVRAEELLAPITHSPAGGIPFNRRSSYLDRRTEPLLRFAVTVLKNCPHVMVMLSAHPAKKQTVDCCSCFRSMSRFERRQKTQIGHGNALYFQGDYQVDEYVQKINMERVARVKKFLMDRGVQERQIQCQILDAERGYGKWAVVRFLPLENKAAPPGLGLKEVMKGKAKSKSLAEDDDIPSRESSEITDDSLDSDGNKRKQDVTNTSQQLAIQDVRDLKPQDRSNPAAYEDATCSLDDLSVSIYSVGTDVVWETSTVAGDSICGECGQHKRNSRYFNQADESKFWSDRAMATMAVNEERSDSNAHVTALPPDLQGKAPTGSVPMQKDAGQLSGFLESLLPASLRSVLLGNYCCSKPCDSVLTEGSNDFREIRQELARIRGEAVIRQDLSRRRSESHPHT